MDGESFVDLGKEPSKVNDIGREDKIQYPCAYGIGVDEFPAMKDMKLGDTGEAVIRFRPQGDGIEIIGIKWLGTADPKAEADKQKLLDRHKKDQMRKSSEPTQDADQGGGYGGSL